jgi:NitT/TauT family transport system substrate-binding protein
VVLTVGCERKSGGPGTGGTPSEVRLGYFANLTHAQAVLGVSSGEFAAAIKPAKLTTHVFNAGPSLIEALFAGEIDIGYIGPGPALNAHVQSRGKGVRIIAGAAANGVVIVARKDRGITKLEDLKGKRIATPQRGNTQDIAARHYLLKVLGQASDENVIPIANAEQLGMMARGQIDAAWSPEPWGARLVQEAGGVVIAEEKDLWPEKRFALTLVITTPEFLAQHPDIVRRMLTVHTQWTERLQRDPASYIPELGAALNALTGQKLAAEVVQAAMARTEFLNEPLPHTLQTFAQWSSDLAGTAVPDLTGLVDTKILESLMSGAPTPAAAPASSPGH